MVRAPFLSTSENVDVVDENDEPQCVTSLKECKKKGLLHRSVVVFLRNSQHEILLQRRSFSDDWLPGKWTISSTGHVRAGELPSQASIRELKEELGVDGKPRFIFKCNLPKITCSGQTEFEIAYAFEVVSDVEFILDPREIEEVRFLSLEEILKLLQEHPQELTPDSIILLEKYFDSKR